jgi:hypothetical protein
MDEVDDCLDQVGVEVDVRLEFEPTDKPPLGVFEHVGPI